MTEIVQINDSQHCLYQPIVYKYICYADQRFKEPGKSEMQTWFVIIIITKNTAFSKLYAIGLFCLKIYL